MLLCAAEKAVSKGKETQAFLQGQIATLEADRQKVYSNLHNFPPTFIFSFPSPSVVHRLFRQWRR